MAKFFIFAEADQGEGLTKDPEGFTPIERQTLQSDSTGVDQFHKGIYMTNTDREKTRAALSAWSSYESFT